MQTHDVHYIFKKCHQGERPRNRFSRCSDDVLQKLGRGASRLHQSLQSCGRRHLAGIPKREKPGIRRPCNPRCGGCAPGFRGNKDAGLQLELLGFVADGRPQFFAQRLAVDHFHAVAAQASGQANTMTQPVVSLVFHSEFDFAVVSKVASPSPESARAAAGHRPCCALS